ncbi:uncharacterized protein TNCV_2112011 [Trichonephila clavipes]|nr:uncharacterized protein TNCV_2112011 [Trichonephila clavipes]
MPEPKFSQVAIWKRWNTTKNDILENQLFAATAIRIPNTSIANKTAYFQESGLSGPRVTSGSNPGEDMDVCKCIMPSRHVGTLNSRRAASHLVRLVEGEERWEAPDHP